MENRLAISEISKAREISKAKDDMTIAKKVSENILISKDPELNYYAVLHLLVNKKEHLQEIIKSHDPLYNYKCVKHCMKTFSLTTEEKKHFINKHCEIVLNSNNEKLISELKNFLKYNKPQGKQSNIGNNSTRRKKK